MKLCLGFFCRLVAHAIETLKLEKGSAIAIDMPMDVNSVVIYLAIVLAGYVVVSIADSFAPSEISARLKISKAKAIFTQARILFISLCMKDYHISNACIMSYQSAIS